MSKTNTDLLDEKDQEDAVPAMVTKVVNASYLSPALSNVGIDGHPGSLLRETRGTGLGGQDKKPPILIERK